MANKKKYYVVWEGMNPGIYDSWDACKLQINGYPGARYKGFATKAEAEEAYAGQPSSHIQYKSPVSRPKQAAVSISAAQIIKESLCVDAACSGNPGVMEYRGVETGNGVEIFHKKFELGTNNIGEFLAIVHALALLQRQGKDTPIYTDSRNAILWVKQKKCKTKLVRNAKTRQLYEIIERAEKWLQEHTWKNPILKWETEHWGEIPADFGRK